MLSPCMCIILWWDVASCSFEQQSTKVCMSTYPTCILKNEVLTEHSTILFCSVMCRTQNLQYSSFLAFNISIPKIKTIQLEKMYW